MRHNLGRLRDKIELSNNIVYYRKGKDEMSINLTNKCPNACCFCIRDRDPGWKVSNLYLKEDPSLSEIKKAIKDELDTVGHATVKKVKICGYGEPVLRIKILPSLISFIKHQCPNASIQLATTGWPVFDINNGTKYFKQSASAGLDQIYLGLNALNAKDYERIVNPGKNADEAFSQVLEFIRISKQLGLGVNISFVDIGGLREREIRKFTERFKCAFHIRKFEK